MMLNKSDNKIVVDMMEMAGGDFPVVKVSGGKCYSTNGQALVVRNLSSDIGEFTLSKDDKNIIKASVNKEIPTIDDSKFPPLDIVDKALSNEFKFEICLNADNLLKALKALKGKDNRVVLKIRESDLPILMSHDNGEALISPII